MLQILFGFIKILVNVILDVNLRILIPEFIGQSNAP